MRLHKPFYISSRLTAAIKVADAEICMQFKERATDGACVYYWWFETNGTGHTILDANGSAIRACGDDIFSGKCSGGNTPALLQEMFVTFLNCLSAGGEAYKYRNDDSNDDDLPFSLEMCEWAAQHSDEIDMMSIELKETEGLLTPN